MSKFTKNDTVSGAFFILYFKCRWSLPALFFLCQNIPDLVSCNDT